jgi:hypothetical protein
MMGTKNAMSGLPSHMLMFQSGEGGKSGAATPKHRNGMEGAPRSNKRGREEEIDNSERSLLFGKESQSTEEEDGHLQKRHKGDEDVNVNEDASGDITTSTDFIDSMIQLKSAPLPLNQFPINPSFPTIPIPSRPLVHSFSFTARSPQKSLSSSRLPLPLVAQTPFADTSNNSSPRRQYGYGDTPKDKDTMYGGERGSSSRFGETGG